MRNNHFGPFLQTDITLLATSAIEAECLIKESQYKEFGMFFIIANDTERDKEFRKKAQEFIAFVINNFIKRDLEFITFSYYRAQLDLFSVN